MTAVPTLAYFRRHALPVHFLADLDMNRPRAALAVAAGLPARPQLATSWHAGADGRPVLRWTIVDQASVLSG